MYFCAGLPCFRGQSFGPPYLNKNCSAAEKGAITVFGSELLHQMQVGFVVLSDLARDGLDCTDFQC